MIERFYQFKVPFMLCDQILNVANASPSRIDATVEGIEHPDHAHRKTEITWLGHGWYDKIFTDAGYEANANWGLDLSGSENIQVGWYTDGGHYKMHCDENPFNTSNGCHRKITVVMCLSDDYEGGELELDGCGKFKLKKGDGIAFPSLLLHGVHPVTSGERITAVKWLTGPFYR